jgi:hypothetical protein
LQGEPTQDTDTLYDSAGENSNPLEKCLLLERVINIDFLFFSPSLFDPFLQLFQLRWNHKQKKTGKKNLIITTNKKKLKNNKKENYQQTGLSAPTSVHDFFFIIS